MNIVITGASSGLGEGMAREFAQRGHNLALCARRLDRLELLKAELAESAPTIKVDVQVMDVNDHDQVFAVMKGFRQTFKTLDRVVINAGMGKGASLGTGYFEANRQTAETNFVGALAQCEAAMQVFRDQGYGHLVTVCSVSAIRGMPGPMTVYAATKAGLAALTEGIRADTLDSNIDVTTLYPGYIESEMTARVRNAPFMVDTETGCRGLVNAMEKKAITAFVPWWPWSPLARAMKWLPLGVIKRMFS